MGLKAFVVPVEVCRQIELELAASKAEVEKLKTEYWFMEEAMSKEIATLKEQRDEVIEIADVLRSGGSRACRELHHSKRDRHEYGESCPVEERIEKAESELDQLKATMNHDKK